MEACLREGTVARDLALRMGVLHDSQRIHFSQCSEKTLPTMLSENTP